MIIGENLNNFKEEGGRISVSIIPNGISKLCNPKFSLIFGLRCEDEGIVKVDSPKNLMKEIIEYISTVNYTINVIEVEYKYSYKFKLEINKKIPKKWNSESMEKLDCFKYLKCKPIATGTDIKTPFFELEDKILEKLLEVPYDPITHLSMYLTEKFGDRKNEFTKQDITAYVNSLRNETKNRNILYDSLDAKGREVPNKNIQSASGYDNLNNQDCSYDIGEAIQYILGYPQAAKDLGLICDFEIQDKNPIQYFNFIDKENNKRISVELGTKDKSDKFYYNKDNFLDKKGITVYKKENLGKFFHGLYNKFTEYGCYKLGSNQHFYFNTINPEQNIQTANFNAETAYEEYVKGNKIISNKKFNIPRTEGIVLTANSSYVKEKYNDGKNANDVVEFGILGYAVAVKAKYSEKNEKKEKNEKNEKKELPLTSLCERIPKFKKLTLDIKSPKTETGMLCNDVSMISLGNGSYDPQVIFSWSGNNLCLEGIDKQPSLSKDNVKKKFEEIFSVEYKQPKSNVMLVDKREYEFIMHDVYANGYSIPIETPKDSCELSLKDLLSESSLIGKHSFNLKDPIRTPIILQTKKDYNEKRDSIDSIVLRNNENTVRFLLPPSIDMQYAFFLGILTPEFTKSNTIDEFVETTYSLLERAKQVPPAFYNCDELFYLPDIRSENLYMTPGDWFTATCFRKMIKDKDKEKINLEILNRWDAKDIDSLNMIKPIKFLVNSLPYKSNKHFSFQSNGRTIDLSIKVGRVITIAIQSGKPKPIPDCDNIIELLDLEGVLFETCYPEELKYPRHNIVISNASFRTKNEKRFTVVPVAKSTKNKIHENFFIADRPDTSRPDIRDPKKILVNFNAKNFDNFETDKVLAISSMKWMNDENQNLPVSMFEESIDEWNNNCNNSESALLENECPGSVFNITTKNLVEEQVYKNNFGFEFNFDNSYFKRYVKGMKIIDFKFAQDCSLEIIYDKIGSDNLQYGKVWMMLGKELIDLPLIPPISLKDENKILLHYNFNQCSSPLELELQINEEKYIFFDSQYQKDILDNSTQKELIKEIKNKQFIERIPLPNRDLSEKHLSLSEDLTIKYCTYLNKEANLNFIYDNDFFIYRSEAYTGYREKKCFLKTTSRLSDLQSKEIDNSLFSNSFNVIVPNNTKPVTPSFNITPLVVKSTLDKDGAFIEKERTFQLMFEIDRSRKNEEYFGLVVGRKINDSIFEMDKFCSQIGRDFTTYSDGVKDEPPTKPLEFGSDKKYPYLSKYIHSREDIVYNDKYYQVQLFETFFDYNKDKWIFVIDLNDLIKEKELYNPFLKIVAVNYQSKLSTKKMFEFSDFTKPKYFPLFSPRKIQLDRKGDEVDVTIDSSTSLKMGGNLIRSHFAVCCREHQCGNIILGNPVYSELKSGQKWESKLWHQIQRGEKNTIRVSGNPLICIYEFESFDNTKIDFADVLGKKTIMDESSFRLIYAEDF
jgi:hypothetical protein